MFGRLALLACGVAVCGIARVTVGNTPDAQPIAAIVNPAACHALQRARERKAQQLATFNRYYCHMLGCYGDALGLKADVRRLDGQLADAGCH